MTSTELSEFLSKRVALFDSFAAGAIADIVAKSEVRSFEGNEAIVACGEEGRFFGVLVSGRATISITEPSGDRLLISDLADGDVFGEMALLTGDRSVVDVIAGTRCFVLTIPHDVFNSRIVTQPKAVMFLSRLLAERTRELAVDVASSQMHAKAVAKADDPYALSLHSDIAGKILALNIGHSQIRFGVYDTQNDGFSVHGTIEGLERSMVEITLDTPQGRSRRERPHFPVSDLFAVLFEEVHGLGGDYMFLPQDVVVVGHRVVHGGSKFSSSVRVTPQVMADIEQLAVLAPFHNPVNLEGIREAMKFFPAIPHIAVFDTAFHQTLPPYAYLYGLPYEWYKQQGIRRYGFHGTSHRHVSLKSAEVLKQPLGELEIISCHLGIGASVCAIDHGRSIDTTMGFTPAGGLIMSSRAGDLDPAIVLYLMREHKLDAEAISQLVNAESGLKGISGISADIDEIEAAANEGHHRALMAHKAFCYQIRKTIGAYVAAMGGVDVLAFTGKIGEVSATVRSLACQGLGYMGIKLDEARNRDLRETKSFSVISADDSRVKVLVIASNDEQLVAWEALRGAERTQLAAEVQGVAQEPIPIEVSAHHVHLAQSEVDQLFGHGHQLTPEHELSQPGQYACAEKVNLVGPKGRINNVRVLGPTRKETQVEIAMTEQFKLGIQPPIRESGDLSGTPGITLEGPGGISVLSRGVICAQRHIHMSPEDALRRGVRDKYVVSVRAKGERELVFGDVVVRVSPNYRLALHIDTDEGNAASVQTGMVGFIDEIQSRR